MQTRTLILTNQTQFPAFFADQGLINSLLALGATRRFADRNDLGGRFSIDGSLYAVHVSAPNDVAADAIAANVRTRLIQRSISVSQPIVDFQAYTYLPENRATWLPATLGGIPITFNDTPTLLARAKTNLKSNAFEYALAAGSLLTAGYLLS